MDSNLTALTYDEITTAKAAIRVIRYATTLAIAVALPILVVLATPIVAGLLLAAIFASPLLLAAGVFAAARRPAAARGS